MSLGQVGFHPRARPAARLRARFAGGVPINAVRQACSSLIARFSASTIASSSFEPAVFLTVRVGAFDAVGF